MTEELNFQIFFNTKVKEKGYTLEKLSKASGIALKHLESFSGGNLQNLPAAPYSHGYLVRLGQILDFDAELWWSKLKQENVVKTSGANDELPHNRFKQTNVSKSWVVGSAVGVLVLIYFGFRFSKIIGEPTLVVTTPSQSPISVQNADLLVQGTLSDGDSLFVNDTPVSVDSNGHWEKNIHLDRVNYIVIRAKKFLGQEVRVERQVFYEAPSQLPLGTTGSASSTGSTGSPQASSSPATNTPSTIP